MKLQEYLDMHFPKKTEEVIYSISGFIIEDGGNLSDYVNLKIFSPSKLHLWLQVHSIFFATAQLSFHQLCRFENWRLLLYVYA